MKKLFVILLTMMAITGYGQKQLVLVKGERVILRLRPGDEFIYKLKGSSEKKVSYINNLFENAVLAHHDTILFHKIERIYFHRVTRGNVIGVALVVGGGLLFAIDNINNTLIQGNDFKIDEGISLASLSSIGVGLPLMLIKKKSQKIGYRNKLLTVKRGSIFYIPDAEGYDSPFLD